jgi:2-alkenal reductase
MSMQSKRLSSLLAAVLFSVLLLATTSSLQAQEAAADLADLYDRANTAVVGVRAVSASEDPFAPQSGAQQGAGFFFDGEGRIVTTQRLIVDATRVEVALLDGSLLEADIVGQDPVSNIAVIQVNVPQEQSAAISVVATNTLRVGQSVVALGSPFGDRATLTTGVVRGVNRQVPEIASFSLGGVIQTDADISASENGGPLLNLDAEVVGLNAIEPGGGPAYAIPGTIVQRIAEQLIENGDIAYSFLGITGEDVSLPIIQTFDLPEGFRGAVVNEVFNGTPASRGGLRSAVYTTGPDGLITPQSVDIITSVDGTIITSVDDLFLYLSLSTQPEQTITVSIRRISGPDTQDSRQLEVVLGQRDAN